MKRSAARPASISVSVQAVSPENAIVRPSASSRNASDGAPARVVGGERRHGDVLDLVAAADLQLVKAQLEAQGTLRRAGKQRFARRLQPLRQSLRSGDR